MILAKSDGITGGLHRDQTNAKADEMHVHVCTLSLQHSLKLCLLMSFRTALGRYTLPKLNLSTEDIIFNFARRQLTVGYSLRNTTNKKFSIPRALLYFKRENWLANIH